ncbi:hypothetical protein ACXR2T_05095 [Leucobacter sp. HY1910]
MAHLKIDPDLPLCWEDPETLRVGFERAHARLHDPSPGVQRLLYALLRGIDPRRIAESASAVGITTREAELVIDTLAPALVSPSQSPGSPPGLRMAISDDGRAVPWLVEAIAATGLCDLSYDYERELPDLIVYVERFLEPLERAQRWLIAGVPQLLVRFTDTAVHVGPIVEPPGVPCHMCVTLEFIARDPAYPVLAAQLAAVKPQSETRAAVGIAASIAAALMTDWVAGAGHVHATRVVIPTSPVLLAAAPRIEQVTPHPECACTLRR